MIRILRGICLGICLSFAVILFSEPSQFKFFGTIFLVIFLWLLPIAITEEIEEYNSKIK